MSLLDFFLFKKKFIINITLSVSATINFISFSRPLSMKNRLSVGLGKDLISHLFVDLINTVILMFQRRHHTR